MATLPRSSPPISGVTVKTVAAHAEVSAQTVSRVLRGSGYVSAETRRKVLAAVEAVGYRPNVMGRSLRATRTPMVGMVITDITNPFYARLHRALEAVFRQRGLTLMLVNSDDDLETEQQQLELVSSYRPRGLVLAPAVHSALTERDLAACGHYVLVSRTLPTIAAPGVVTNERDVMAEATRELIAAGHRDIVAVLGPQGASTTDHREDGYRTAMTKAGLRPLSRYTDQTAAGARSAIAETLRAHPAVTAALSFNTPVTVGVLAGLSDLRLLCPNDFSLIGFTDAPWMEFFRPPISVIDQPVELMGRHAAELLLNLIDGRDVAPVEHVVPCRLLRRGSVGPPRTGRNRS